MDVQHVRASIDVGSFNTLDTKSTVSETAFDDAAALATAASFFTDNDEPAVVALVLVLLLLLISLAYMDALIISSCCNISDSPNVLSER